MAAAASGLRTCVKGDAHQDFNPHGPQIMPPVVGVDHVQVVTQSTQEAVSQSLVSDESLSGLELIALGTGAAWPCFA